MTDLPIDWNTLWKEIRSKKSWRTKTSRDWDDKAPSFAKRNINSEFTEQFIKHIKPDPSWTVLDVGSGPGTLSIPLAPMVRHITALDYSPRMLEILQQSAKDAGLHNITAIRCSWEDDWDRLGIKQHDVAIASRSLSVENLQAALKKLNDKAAKKVFIADRVGSGPFDPEIFKAVGRDFNPGPDYIFTVNILYQMGIYARVDFVRNERQKYFASRQEAIESCAWMLENLTENEKERLKHHIFSRLEQTGKKSWRLTRINPPQWALISWDREDLPVAE